MKKRVRFSPGSPLIYKALAFVLFSLAFGLKSEAQQVKEPEWTYTFSKNEVAVGDEVELIFKSQAPFDWYMYANGFDPDLGPHIARLEMEAHPSYKLIGDLKPIGAKRKFDETWEGDVVIFSGKVELRQKIKILSQDVQIKGLIFYQICSDVVGLCKDFERGFNFPALKVKPATTPNTSNEKNPSTIASDPTEDTTGRSVAVDTMNPALTESSSPSDMATNVDAPVVEEDEDDLLKKSLLTLFLLGFAVGFGAVLTPCVFPMLPMTVAFFTKRQEKGKGRKMALFYGFSIVLIYTVFGLILSSLFGATFGYAISTHWFPNLLFFVIFMIFGFSFLGAFELVLPSGFVNKIDKNSDRGGYIGVFFIALTLVVISFSCTVPIVGSVAILAENGELMRPLAAMLGFSISFALPFTLFAFFPQWMSKLPKSGGWLNSVKVCFGIIEIALALKFFSQADLAYHWGILDRDVFLALWIVLAFLMGFYFLGKIKFSHDTDLRHVSVPRFFMAFFAFGFGIYLIPGLFGAPLKPLAGILPPISTQDFVGAGPAVASTHKNDSILHSDVLHTPLGLPGYYDYEQGMAAAKKMGKPAFIDFTGWSCANCRKVEENVWPNPEVLKRLKNDVVIISLYTDETKVLPEDKWYTSKRDGNLLKTVGQQNLDREIEQFGENAQPMYFIVDETGKVLSRFNGYKNDPVAYAAFIDKGVAAYKAQQNAQ